MTHDTLREGHIDVGTTSVQLDTTIVTQSTGEFGEERHVHREGVFVGDPQETAARANVMKGRDDGYELSVSGSETRSIARTLDAIYERLGDIENLLESIAN